MGAAPALTGAEDPSRAQAWATIGGMTWQRILAVLAAVALGAGAWRAAGWSGLALLASGLVFWALLYVTRLVQVMKLSKPILKKYRDQKKAAEKEASRT